jgi:uncharacterized damage-inducible protein DinB
MLTLDAVVPAFRYSEAMNEQLFSAAVKLTARQLDEPYEMGFGSLRRTLEHIQHGETVWLARWQGDVECAWPAFEPGIAVDVLKARLSETVQKRDAWVRTLDNADFGKVHRYRDSKGGLFQASLRDMLRQGMFHSVHHRAQAVNMLRQLTGAGLEMDYMAHVRVAVAGNPDLQSNSGEACKI